MSFWTIPDSGLPSEGPSLFLSLPFPLFIQLLYLLGLSVYASFYQGYEWLFASKSNKDLFDRHPAHYVPEYGGYCAYAVAESDARGNFKDLGFRIV